MTGRPKLLSLMTGATLLAAGGAAQAQSLDAAVLAASCVNCHGTDGKSSGPIPSLAGRPAIAIAAQMKAFKSETPPPGTTIMNRLAKGYTDEQIETLAKYFSEKK